MDRMLRAVPFAGRVEWLGIAASRMGAIQICRQIDLVTAAGIRGEHHFRQNSNSKRQVTIIQEEHLSVVARLLLRQQLDPALLRRNIVVSGINLAALKSQTIQLGSAVVRVTGGCPPCSRMEESLGAGGYVAMVGHGGITAVVDAGGTVSVGDSVSVIPVHQATGNDDTATLRK